MNHVVHFYGADDELADTVGRYLADGIRSGDGVVVVASAPHRLAFEATASSLIGRAAAGGRPVRVYAEMVALLWDAGDVALAIELEDLWTKLAARVPFGLLCGYPDSVLAQAGTAGAVRDVCQLHSAVADQRNFAAELDSVRAARHYVTGLLDVGADEAAACDSAIVATELAANAVLHARSGFTMTVSWSAGVTRIAVRDKTPVHELAVTEREAAGEDIPFEVMTGHGLSVVAQLASRWAVDPLPDGKVVWAELPGPGLRGPDPAATALPATEPTGTEPTAPLRQET